jgi:hypothetical protein
MSIMCFVFCRISGIDRCIKFAFLFPIFMLLSIATQSMCDGVLTVELSRIKLSITFMVSQFSNYLQQVKLATQISLETPNNNIVVVKIPRDLLHLCYFQLPVSMMIANTLTRMSKMTACFPSISGFSSNLSTSTSSAQ